MLDQCSAKVGIPVGANQAPESFLSSWFLSQNVTFIHYPLLYAICMNLEIDDFYSHNHLFHYALKVYDVTFFFTRNSQATFYILNISSCFTFYCMWISAIG